MTKSQKTEDVDQDEAAEAVNTEPAPNNSARPNDLPIGEFASPNSSFADRAKKAASNKRVEASEAK